MTVKRTTQVAVEAVSQVDPALRASQVAVEMVSSNTLMMQVTQLVVELISQNVPDDTGGSQPAMMIIAT